MSGSVRSSTAFGVAVALAFGVAVGWLLGGGEQGDIDASQESWLFSHTADAGEIRERADGSLELVLRSFDERVTAFADRPFRDAKIEPVEWLVSAWDDLFAESAPNAVLVEHDPDGVAKSVVVVLSSPRLSGGELTYAVTVLDAVPEGRLAGVAGESHENPVRSFQAVSLFIDDVTLSCAQGGACVVGDTGPGGGVVFYVDNSGKYLEAARADLAGSFTWKDAIKQARSYRGGGKADWYLPTRDEQYELYKQRTTVGGFSDANYWSSSVWDSVSAYTTYFGNGDQYGSYTTLSMQVRPVRAG
jgi:hypothetical protein